MLVWNYDRESYDATYNENLVNKMFIGHMKIGRAEANDAVSGTGFIKS